MALKAGYVGVKRWIYEKTVAGVINLKKTQEVTGSVNMFIITKGSDTIQGVTYAVAEDGTVTVNNTATANSLFIANDNMVLPAGVTYRVTKGITDANPQVNVNALNGSSFVKNLVNLTTQKYVEFTPDYDGYDRMQVIICVPNGTAISNKKISIMITPTSAIPDNYLSGAMTNRQLTKAYEITNKTGVTFDDTYCDVSGCSYSLSVKGNLAQIIGVVKISTQVPQYTKFMDGLPAVKSSGGAAFNFALLSSADGTKTYRCYLDTYGKISAHVTPIPVGSYVLSFVYFCAEDATIYTRSLDAASDTREASPEVIEDEPEPVTRKSSKKTTTKEGE